MDVFALLWAGKTRRVRLTAKRDTRDDNDDRAERAAIQTLEREEEDKWKIKQRTLFG
jgi:hypothetical protein